MKKETKNAIPNDLPNGTIQDRMNLVTLISKITAKKQEDTKASIMNKFQELPKEKQVEVMKQIAVLKKQQELVEKHKAEPENQKSQLTLLQKKAIILKLSRQKPPTK